MNNESKGDNPIGLYRNPDNKQEVGCLHPAQADAAVRQGFVLVREGVEAAQGTPKVAPAPAPATPATADNTQKASA